MKTPKHWKNKNFLAKLLYLPACLYALATYLRIKLHKPKKVNIPVLCLGNLTAGGSGKTPCAIAIAKIFKKAGKKPCFVSRGYGGNLQNVEVNTALYSPEEVGDEPLLLAKECTTVVNHNRYEGAKLAIELEADQIIMDDGFQNPTLFKDKSLLVIDGAFGLGNTYPIPAGPMREFLSWGKKRADGIILLGEDETNVLQYFEDLPIFRGKVQPIKPKFEKNRVVAFAGIGRPEKFYTSLEECGANIAKKIDFPDHHFYKDEELEDIMATARKFDAEIFTTAKDWVKIPHKYKSQFKILEINIKWLDENKLKKFLLG